MMILQKNLIKKQNRTKEILFLEIIFLTGKKQKNLLKIIDISIGSGTQIMMLKKEWQELRKKFNNLKMKSYFFSEATEIADENEMISKIENVEFETEFVDEEPITDGSKSELEYK